jgi:hypothetical protein
LDFWCRARRTRCRLLAIAGIVFASISVVFGDALRALVSSLLVLLLFVHGPARAQDEDAKPEVKHLTIAVLGDSLGDGIWGSFYRRLVRDKRYTVFRGAKNSVGFGGETLIDQIDKALAAGPTDAIVMMIGANDRRGIYVDGNLAAPYKSPQCAETYRKRVDDFMDAAAKRGVPLVWILLPIMREEDASVDAKQINAIIVAAAAGRKNVAVVETWPLTVDGEGHYAAYLKNDKGQSWLVRYTDGVHFSDAGYDMISEAAFAKLIAMSPSFQLMTSQK